MPVSKTKTGPGRRRIAASDFKARCLRLIDEVEETGKAYLITKHGKPKALLAPVKSHPRATLGAWRGMVRLKGDVVHTDWSHDFDATQ